MTAPEQAAAASDVSARIAAVLGLDAGRRAVQYEGRWQTWGEVRDRVRHIDRLLTDAGLGEGRPVGLIARNRPGHVAAIQALLATRRCVVPISSIAADEVVRDDVTRLGLPAVIAAPEDWARAGLARRCAGLGVLGIEITDTAAAAATRVLPPLSVARTTAEALDGVAVLMPTSGTTGPPKRIRYTYRHIDGALDRIARYSEATSRSLAGPPGLRTGVVIAHLALAHVGGFWAVLQASAEGRPMALLDRFDPHAWAGLVAEHGVKTSALPPAMLRMVLDADIAPARLASLVAVSCGTAPLDPAAAEEFTGRYGIPVLTAYGATEFPGGTVGWTLGEYRRHWAAKRGSAGRARPGIEIRVVDPDTGEVLPPGTEGILAIRSPQATVTTPDGWVATNDLARIDADGFLWLLGRTDDAINRGGFKIIPQAVEAVLRDHPAVTDAGVVGIPDPRLGQLPVAAVTTRAPVTPADLTAWVRRRLPSHHVPAEIRIVPALPRTASLKIAKTELRAWFETP